jgi:hypothetical protein
MLVPLLILGALFVIVGINGQTSAFTAQMEKDLFSQQGKIGFIEWAGAILALSILFKSIDMPEVGKYILGLVVIIFILKNEQVISQGVQELKSITSPPAAPATAASVAATNPTPIANQQVAMTNPSVSPGQLGAGSAAGVANAAPSNVVPGSAPILPTGSFAGGAIPSMAQGGYGPDANIATGAFGPDMFGN